MGERSAKKMRREVRRFLGANAPAMTGKLALEMAELMRTAGLRVRIPFALKMAFGLLKASDFDSLVPKDGGKGKKEVCR